jgi:hypothetical protein
MSRLDGAVVQQRVLHAADDAHRIADDLLHLEDVATWCSLVL